MPGLGSVLTKAAPLVGSGVDYLQRRSAIGSGQKAITTGGAKSAALYDPYVAAGQQGLRGLRSLTDPNMAAAAVTADPGYQFRLAEGQKAIERSAAARGTLLGGGTLKALTEYGQNFASNEFNNEFNRNKDLATLGYGAAGQQSNIQQQISEAIAQGDYARASELSNAIGTGIDALTGGASGVSGAGGAAALKGVAGAVGKGAAAVGKGVAGAIGAIPLAGQIALGVGGAILLGKKVFGIGNTHEKANEWVSSNQNLFDQAMAQIGQAEQSGQVSPEQATQARNATVQQYMESANDFAAKGGDQRTVVRQALDTFRKYYGDPSQYGATAPGVQNRSILQLAQGVR